MTDNGIAESLAAKFKDRFAAGEVLRSFDADELPENDSTTFYEYIRRTDATHDELREICIQVMDLLGGKGAIDELSGYYVNGVWARLHVGTEEDPDDETRIILVMMRKQP